MCGICGVALTSGATPSRVMIEQMCDALVHRGPDDLGFHLSGGVGLGHRRLSIVDLAGGHQPMPNEDNQIWISFNGEIYNHAELRHRLQAQGHRYHTQSDTESILHLYEQEGPAGFTRLRGMFAFALWDDREQTLVLARDHSGIKPLYYAITPEGDLLFASEVKGLFASGCLIPSLDPEVIPEYFATGHVSGARTLLRGVNKLLPGHWLSWRRGVLKVDHYWCLGSAADDPGKDPARLEDVAREFWHRFRESVELQLMSDVPLGAFLSGGLDSSLIVAAMTELGVPRVETFSVGYADRDANELPFAHSVASHFHTRHHELSVTTEEFFDALPRLTWHRDFPVTFPASIPLALIAEVACRQVKVVLTGEGSDELFAGYGRYPRALLNLRWARRFDRWLPGPARRALQSGAARLGNGFAGSRIRRSFLGQDGSATGAFLEPFSEFGAPDRRKLLEVEGNPFERVAALVDPLLLAREPLEAFLRLDQATYLEELLMKQDTMSMAASLESRVPYLDHTLREWAAAIPAGSKLRGWTGKALVRAAALEHLPQEIAHAGKRGFPVPLAHWFRTATGQEVLTRFALQDLREAGLQRAYPRQLFSQHTKGRDHAAKLWRLLAFGVWMQNTLPRLGALGGRRLEGHRAPQSTTGG